jgi:hypothetical protein
LQYVFGFFGVSGNTERSTVDEGRIFPVKTLKFFRERPPVFLRHRYRRHPRALNNLTAMMSVVNNALKLILAGGSARRLRPEAPPGGSTRSITGITRRHTEKEGVVSDLDLK